MHIIFGELRKAPFIKTGCGQDGQSTMFIIELAEVIKQERKHIQITARLFSLKQPLKLVTTIHH